MSDDRDGRAWSRYQPIGAVLAVMPWNFPFWQVFRFAAPALMAGNVGLLKHASNVPQCALAIEDIFRRAGFAKAYFRLCSSAPSVATRHRRPARAAATLTGSEAAGEPVASAAGEQSQEDRARAGRQRSVHRHAQRGSRRAVETAVKARIINNGQSCIAAKRFIVAREIARRVRARASSQRDGIAARRRSDGRATPRSVRSPPEIRDDLDSQVDATVAAGARVLTGGKRLERPGYYYAPTVLTIPEGSPAYREELFGPVASVFRVRELDEAIRLANDTTFGLGASAWTNDARSRTRFIDEIEAGLVFINGMVASDPRLPFGGVKRSGYGRELGASASASSSTSRPSSWRTRSRVNRSPSSAPLLWRRDFHDPEPHDDHRPTVWYDGFIVRLAGCHVPVRSENQPHVVPSDLDPPCLGVEFAFSIGSRGRRSPDGNLVFE